MELTTANTAWNKSTNNSLCIISRPTRKVTSCYGLTQTLVTVSKAQWLIESSKVFLSAISSVSIDDRGCRQTAALNCLSNLLDRIIWLLAKPTHQLLTQPKHVASDSKIFFNMLNHTGRLCGQRRPTSRAGPATLANLHHLDELRHSSGDDSGELGHWLIWFRIISQQLIDKFLATNLTNTLVNLNLNLAIGKYLNLVMFARNPGQNHYRIVACLVQRVVNLVRQRIVPWSKSHDKVWSNGTDDRTGSWAERRGRVWE